MQSKGDDKPISSLAAAAAKLRVSKDATSANATTEAMKNTTKKSNNARQSISSTLGRADNINKQVHKDNRRNHNKHNNQRHNKSHGNNRQNNLDLNNVRSATTTRESDRGTSLRGRGHNSRGKKNQGRGRTHNQQKQNHRGAAGGINKRIDGDTVRFEYKIDDDHCHGDKDIGGKDELQQSFTSSSKGSRNYRGSTSGDNNTESEGRILDMKASRRLINNALGIRTQKIQSISNGASKSNNRLKKPSLINNMGTKTATKGQGGNKNNSYEKAEEYVDPEIKQQHKVVLLSKGEVDPTTKKSPMKRWADDDDDEDY